MIGFLYCVITMNSMLANFMTLTQSGSCSKEPLREVTLLFDMAWTGKSTTGEKKNIVDNFLNRLSAGYESNPYIDNEIAVLLEEQSKKYSDAKWTAKIKTTIGRHRI